MLAKSMLAAACAATVVAALLIAGADAADDPVTFPAGYRNGVHYGTVRRGNIREELHASAATIVAVKRGEPAPSGSVITLADYRDDRLYRITSIQYVCRSSGDHTQVDNNVITFMHEEPKNGPMTCRDVIGFYERDEFLEPVTAAVSTNNAQIAALIARLQAVEAGLPIDQHVVESLLTRIDGLDARVRQLESGNLGQQ